MTYRSRLLILTTYTLPSGQMPESGVRRIVLPVVSYR